MLTTFKHNSKKVKGKSDKFSGIFVRREVYFFEKFLFIIKRRTWRKEGQRMEVE